MIPAIIFLLGLILGSFLNVCILRIPRGESIVLPASHCTNCGEAIKAYDNIPMLSWIILRGRCRKCREPISWMYPAVELATGLLFLGCYFAFGLTLTGAKWALFASLMIVLVVTDARERILPDKVNFLGLALGIVFSPLLRPVDGLALSLSDRIFAFPPPTPVLALADSLLGMIAGGGLLWIVAEGYFRLRGREGMGLGDVKMMAMAGTFLGLKRTLLTILLGSLLGSVLGLLFIMLFRKDRQYELPFGTFLGASALLVVFFGTPMLNWYQNFVSMR